MGSVAANEGLPGNGGGRERERVEEGEGGA